MFSQFDARISSLEAQLNTQTDLVASLEAQLKTQTDLVASLETTLVEQNERILSLLEKKDTAIIQQICDDMSSLEKSVNKLSPRIASLESTYHNFVLVGFIKNGYTPIYLDKDTTTNEAIYNAFQYEEKTFLAESLKQFSNVKEFDFTNSCWCNNFGGTPPTFRLHFANGLSYPIHKILQNDAEAINSLRKAFTGSHIKIVCRSKLIN